MTTDHVTRDTPAEQPQPDAPTPPTPKTDTPLPAAAVQPRGDTVDYGGKKDRRTPGTEALVKLQRAAVMRAEGATWEQVAMALGYASGDSARATLAGDYPATWARCWTEAREELRPVCEAEAVCTLRELLQPTKPVYDKHGKAAVDEDGTPMREERKEQVRESAAHAMLQHVSRMQAQEINLRLRGNVGRYGSRLDDLEDDELDEIIAAAAAARTARAEQEQGQEQ